MRSPKAYTPDCGFSRMPMPILHNCREPIATGIPDMRGLWLAESGFIGHIERIEQCGNRMVVTSAGLIHDFRMDGTLKNGARDIQTYCTNLASAIKVDDEGKIIFRLFNLFDTVSRHLDSGDMIFTFVDGKQTRMQRACSIPEEDRVCTKPIGTQLRVIVVPSFDLGYFHPVLFLLAAAVGRRPNPRLGQRSSSVISNQLPSGLRRSAPR